MGRSHLDINSFLHIFLLVSLFHSPVDFVTFDVDKLIWLSPHLADLPSGESIRVKETFFFFFLLQEPNLEALVYVLSLEFVTHVCNRVRNVLCGPVGGPADPSCHGRSLLLSSHACVYELGGHSHGPGCCDVEAPM